jgi:RNA binding exosome subunit
MEHKQHLRKMSQTLRENQLYVRFDKCEFWLKKFVFLGYVISTVSIFMDLMKVKTILNGKNLLV